MLSFQHSNQKSSKSSEGLSLCSLLKIKLKLSFFFCFYLLTYLGTDKGETGRRKRENRLVINYSNILGITILLSA